jgi:hypothetical protein
MDIEIQVIASSSSVTAGLRWGSGQWAARGGAVRRGVRIGMGVKRTHGPCCHSRQIYTPPPTTPSPRVKPMSRTTASRSMRTRTMTKVWYLELGEGGWRGRRGPRRDQTRVPYLLTTVNYPPQVTAWSRVTRQQLPFNPTTRAPRQRARRPLPLAPSAARSPLEKFTPILPAQVSALAAAPVITADHHDLLSSLVVTLARGGGWRRRRQQWQGRRRRRRGVVLLLLLGAPGAGPAGAGGGVGGVKGRPGRVCGVHRRRRGRTARDPVAGWGP